MDEDLWGELLPTIRTPIDILKGQANLISEKTGSVVIGDTRLEIGETGITAKLFLKEPKSGVEIEIAAILMDITVYPVLISKDILNNIPFSAGDEEMYKKQLGNILSSEKVKRIILGLMLKSRLLND